MPEYNKAAGWLPANGGKQEKIVPKINGYGQPSLNSLSEFKHRAMIPKTQNPYGPRGAQEGINRIPPADKKKPRFSLAASKAVNANQPKAKEPAPKRPRATRKTAIESKADRAMVQQVLKENRKRNK